MSESAAAELQLDFASFFREQYRSIVADAYFIVGNKDDAMDVADEAFFRTFIRWRKLSRYERPGAWVRRVAIRLAVRFKVRRHKESGKYVVEPSVEYDRSDHLDLRNALLKLPNKMRAAMVLHYFDDLALADVAEAMNCKESTVKRYLHEGRERLRVILST